MNKAMMAKEHKLLCVDSWKLQVLTAKFKVFKNLLLVTKFNKKLPQTASLLEVKPSKEKDTWNFHI